MAKRKSGYAERVGKTEYKRVYEWKNTTGNNPNFFKAQVCFRVDGKMEHFGCVVGSTDKECAIKLDTELIKRGKEPINILKRK